MKIDKNISCLERPVFVGNESSFEKIHFFSEWLERKGKDAPLIEECSSSELVLVLCEGDCVV
ncbi:unnamed protein product [Camellia sinensis]